jgi:DNA-directed RNA polymerase specialized sigma24 family protein
LLQLTPDYGLAEELLQDTLVAVWKSARSFEGRSSVLTWLIGIARRQAHNTLRQRKIPLAI